MYVFIFWECTVNINTCKCQVSHLKKKTDLKKNTKFENLLSYLPKSLEK